MLCKDYTTRLLDMEHMKVKNVENYPDHLILHVEMERRAVPCPRCEALTELVHDYRIQRVKDSPIQGMAWRQIHTRQCFQHSRVLSFVSGAPQKSFPCRFILCEIRQSPVHENDVQFLLLCLD